MQSNRSNTILKTISLVACQKARHLLKMKEHQFTHLFVLVQNYQTQDFCYFQNVFQQQQTKWIINLINLNNYRNVKQNSFNIRHLYFAQRHTQPKSMLKFKIVLTLFLAASIVSSLDPLRQIQLYPNTQNSDSIYIFSFKLQKNIPAQSYILINLDWYSAALTPYECIMVNSTIQLSCTNFAAPTFALTITPSQLLEHNYLLSTTKTVAVLLKNNLLKDTEYNLQLHLFNTVPNIRKISPSAQIYVVSKQGLVYEENINYGPAINRPPIDIYLIVSVLNNLSLNKPGELSTFKAEFRISQPIQTTLSAFTLVLHYPFSFSLGSLPRTYASELSVTNPIALYQKPTIAEYRIISPNIFYVVFSQKFVANRRFILQVTEINNPFFLAQSNISIYSMNYNSLTPLQGLEHGCAIQTVSYSLVVTLGFPYDQSPTGPRLFYKSTYQYVKVDVTIPKTVPTGYSIRIVITGGAITEGSAYANFESLDIEPVYVYGSNFIIIKGIGQILVGSKIQTTFQILKNTITVFSFNVYIDKQTVINTFTAAKYMYEGRAEGTSVNKYTFVNNFYDNVFSTSWRISQDVFSNTFIIILIYPYSWDTPITSTGAYLQVYLSPNFIVDDDFNANNDCRFANVVGSATCLREKTANHLKLTIKSTNNALNPFPINTHQYIYIYNILAPRSSSNKFIYSCYFTLFVNGAPGATEYYDTRIISVMPKYNGLANFKMEQQSNVYDSDFTYPGFLRVQSITPAEMNYIIQQNEIRVIVLVSRYGFQGMGAINNQDPYPCTSNIDVKCTFLAGHKDFASLEHVLQWDRVAIFFPSGQQNSKIFHVIVPDSVRDRQNNYYYPFVGVYNKKTKDYKYLYMQDAFRRDSWYGSGPINVNTGLYVQFGGRAGSYRKNVTINVANPNRYTGDFSFLCISTSWPFYEKGISSINALSLAVTDPKLGNNQAQPVSVYMSSNMYLTVIPIKYLSGSVPTTFKIMLDDVHMPYDYDLPSYYIYFIDSGTTPNGNSMSASNQFIMTNANIFYECPLKALTISCLNNALGVKNTICTIVFGTQNPLKADGKIILVFKGMTIATDVCKFYHSNSSLLPSTCISTADNRNLTVSLSGWQHYPAGNFTLIISGVGIESTQISQSLTLYLYDITAKYIIEVGNRILTTTIAKQKIIEVYEILYSYNSPLSYNKMAIKFYLPRDIYNDEEFGFIMGKDLSDVNTQIKRLNIKLIKSDGTELSFLYKLISSEYKVIFAFDNPALLTQSNYTLEIYGIRTPASHENGQFNIIFQRKFDKKYTLINQIGAAFPTLQNYIISDMSLVSYFNTEGYDQQIDITIKNRAISVNDKMIWIINFPSYYSPLIFNYEPYCLIDGSPIDCSVDPNTQYQLIIKNSPQIIAATVSYKISIVGVACPRVKYMSNIFPNRYIFIGILENSLSDYYEETSLIYPEQNVYNSIPGIIGIQNIEVSSTQLTSFYSVYMTIVLKCNIAINAGEYLYIVFPPEFNNFNNKPLDVIIRTTSVLGTASAPILDRRLQILIPSTIPLNTELRIQMTSVPTPTLELSSQMSKIISFVTLSTKKRLTAASATSGNSAPKLTFTKDPRYISFNNDQQIVITAGTYSQLISVKSSNSNPFLTNVKVALVSTGFLFQPAQVFLKLGNDKGEFRIGADKDLYPISYFYSTIKQQQVQTFYKITTNNNIRITNVPVSIAIPLSINLPKGGCSQPLLIKLSNPPTIDMSITFNYNNSQYNQNVLYPNPHTTKSSLVFTRDNDNNTLSLCTSADITGTSIEVTMVLAGTNYNSYKFTPSNIITFNLVTLPALPSPTVQVKMINQQKTFVDFNLTLNVDGLVYYELLIGDSTANGLPVEKIQIYIKNQVSLIQSRANFLTNIYLNDRDQRVGQVYYAAGQHTLRFTDMIPQTSYVFCTYLQNKLKVLRGPFCQVIQTQSWGQINALKVKFSKSISAFQLNKVMCFFTKFVDTKTNYLSNIEGNSCNDNAVKNINFNYPGLTYTNQRRQTIIYLVTNPYLTSDPSPVAFQNLFDANNLLSSTALALALSGYGIDFMSGFYVKRMDARSSSSRKLAQNIEITFSKPVFTASTLKISIGNIFINSDKNQYGTVYFLLVLYKEFVTNPASNETSVKIRLNAEPTPWQMINCKNWQNNTAQGCARAVYSGSLLSVQMSGIQQNAMYILYYMVANEFPFRPVVAYTVRYETVVTMSYAYDLVGKGLLILLVFFVVLY